MTDDDNSNVPPLPSYALERMLAAMWKSGLTPEPRNEGSPAVRGRIEWDTVRQMTAILPASKQVREQVPLDGPHEAPTED